MRRAPLKGSWMLLSILTTSAVLHAAVQPTPVSPGQAYEISTVRGSCPTFSWSVDSSATGHELVIYRVDDGSSAAGSPILQMGLPGAVGSWTPSVEQCLHHGEAYAWSVRAWYEESDGPWSDTHLFRIDTAPTEMELEQALDVLRRHAESKSASRDPMPEPSTFLPAPRAAGFPTPSATQERQMNASTVGFPTPSTTQGPQMSVSTVLPVTSTGMFVEMPGNGTDSEIGVHATVPASSSEDSRFGLVGEVLGFSSLRNSFGVYGITGAEKGAGVRADAYASTGSAIGIEAVSNSPDGYAGMFSKLADGAVVRIDAGDVALEANGSVALEANGEVVVNHRLNVVNDFEAGAGVRAETSAASGSAVAIEAISNAPDGYAGRFIKPAGGTVVRIDAGDVALEANGEVVVNGRLNVPSWTQVTATGNTGATATCPEFTTVVFGLYWHMTDTEAAQKAAFGACTPGLASCSVSAADNPGNDEVRVWALCGSD